MTPEAAGWKSLLLHLQMIDMDPEELIVAPSEFEITGSSKETLQDENTQFSLKCSLVTSFKILNLFPWLFINALLEGTYTIKNQIALK